jgi:hypothetical protein
MLRLRAPDPTEPVNSSLLQTFPERYSKMEFGVTAMLSYAGRCQEISGLHYPGGNELLFLALDFTVIVADHTMIPAIFLFG